MSNAFLHKKYAYLLFGLFIGLQLMRAWSFFSYENSDRNRQVTQAAQWVNHGRLSVTTVNPIDWAQEIREAPYAWPPGYPIALSGLYLLLQDWFQAIEWLHFIALAWTLIGISLAWQQLVPLSWSGLSLGWCLVWGLNFSPFTYMGTTDMWAVGAWLWSVIFYVFAQKKKGKRYLLWLCLHVICISWAIWMRYAYLPLAFISLFLLCRDLRLQPKGIRLFPVVILILNILGLIYYKDFVAGIPATALLTEAGSPPYLHHVLAIDPFLIKGIWYVSAEKLGHILSMHPYWPRLGLWSLSVLIASWLIYSWRTSQKSLPPLIVYIGLGGMGTLGLLFGLSLFSPAELWDDGTIWTYVSESRYYAPCHIFFMLVSWYLLHELSPGTWLRRASFLGLGILGLIAVGHSISRWNEMRDEDRTRQGRRSSFETDLHWTYAFVEQQVATGFPVSFVYGDWYEYAEEQTIATWAGANSICFTPTVFESVYLSDTICLIANLRLEEWEMLYSQISPFLIQGPDTLGGKKINQEHVYKALLAPTSDSLYQNDSIRSDSLLLFDRY